MEIEKIGEVLIYFIHAPLGAIALLAGGIALVVKKGNKVHKKSGKVFYFSMLLSAMAALLIAVLPNHKSPFLFSIGLFSSYFLISGLRSLTYKQKEVDLKMDKIIAYLIMITGITMVLYPLILERKLNVILTVFGTAGLMFGTRDLLLFRDIERLKNKWLDLHLGKMTGGYIAAITAFFVVNEILPGIWNWFVPAMVGSVYITFWRRKLNKSA